MRGELKSTRFRREREGDWKALERLLKRLETAPVSRLGDDELLALPVLYRSALSSLSVARETSLDQGLLDYLEDLCSRAYFAVYGARPHVGARVAHFFTCDWPGAARALWKETLLAAGLFFVGAGIAFWLFGLDPDWYFSFIPQDIAQGRTPATSSEALREMIYGGDQKSFLTGFAAFLFTHNAQVSLFAFALGFAFGLPTAFLVLSNGCTLGALVALYASRGMGVDIVGWLAIHGVTEILAVVLAAAGGFHIGWALAFPGARSRVDALAAAGRRAATLMAGVLVMLFCAGLLEGVGRQLVTNVVARYAIAATTALIWGIYLYAPRRGRP